MQKLVLTSCNSCSDSWNIPTFLKKIAKAMWKLILTSRNSCSDSQNIPTFLKKIAKAMWKLVLTSCNNFTYLIEPSDVFGKKSQCYLETSTNFY